MTGKTQGGNEVCKIFLSLWQRTWLTLPCNSVLPLMGLFITVLYRVDRDFALRFLGSRAYWAYREGPVSGWESFVNHLFTLYLVFSHAPCPPHPFLFFFLIHSPSKSFISWEWAIKKIRIFFFPLHKALSRAPLNLQQVTKKNTPRRV